MILIMIVSRPAPCSDGLRPSHESQRPLPNGSPGVWHRRPTIAAAEIELRPHSWSSGCPTIISCCASKICLCLRFRRPCVDRILRLSPSRMTTLLLLSGS